MYARITTLKIDPARLAELPAKVKGLGPASKAMPGVIDVYFAWRSDGDAKVTAVFASKADADAGFPKVQAIWADLASLLKAPPSVETFDNVEHIAG